MESKLEDDISAAKGLDEDQQLQRSWSWKKAALAAVAVAAAGFAAAAVFRRSPAAAAAAQAAAAQWLAAGRDAALSLAARSKVVAMRSKSAVTE